MKRHFEKRRLFRIVSLCLGCILLTAPLAAGEDLALHGFAQANWTARITGQTLPGPEGGDFLLGDERVQLALSQAEGRARLFSKLDLFHDAVADKSDLEIRESYLDYGTGDISIRVGRQIMTWGVGDLIFINDLFPKDYGAFFSGRPLEYLKVGSDAAKLDLSSDLLSAELVVIPFFEADRLPSSQRFFLFDPFAALPHISVTPQAGFENTELALRLYRNVRGFDAALYAYKGFFGSPGVRPDNPTLPTQVTLFYPRLAVYGASVQGNALGGVVSLEAGYDDSLDDRSGSDPAIPNSMLKYLLGYQRQIWTDFTAGFQYYGEYMQDYGTYLETLPSGFPPRDQLRQLLTVRLTQLLRYQTLRLSFFGFYSPTDEDYALMPEVRYNFTDALWGSVGANIFGGKKETTFFGQLAPNNNIYGMMRYEF
ncbi:MAG: hypothetical protein ACYDBV_01065 [Nitrospiria bacterium]